MSRKYLIRITELERLLSEQAEALRQKDQQLSLVEETEAFLRSALARAEEKIEEEEREIEHLRAQIEKLRRMLFGTRSEKLQREVEQAEAQLKQREQESDRYSGREDDPQVPRQLRQSRHRRPLPAHLPREIHRLEPEESCCPECGSELDYLGEVSAEQLELVSSALKVIRTVRVKKACTKCDCIVEAPAPSRPIERGIAGSGLLARVLTGKYCEHLPLYRQSEIFARQGIELSRALLSNWVDACCQLMTPLNDTLYRYVMNTRKVHTDDTPVKVLAPGRKKAKTGRIWTYVRDDRNAGSSEPPAVWFAYSPDRQGKHPVQHLRPFRGILQADAFSGYDRLFSAEREGGALTEVACWAHARRGFADLYKISKDPRAAIAVKKIAGLYRLEKKISSRPVEKIRQWRQRYARPILEDLWSWLEEQEPQCSPG
ncbi:IS66 family transposase, partial [Escherichia coli]|nr:IS66 family transposase [Escherichia coli]